MSSSDRAKQFLPFDALNGFQLALREKEKIIVDKKELSEEMKEELSKKLNSLEIGDKVKIIHYKNKQYKIDVGIFNQINRVQRFIIVGNNKIAIDNIFRIYDL